MAPLHSLVVATSLAIAWDSRGITEQVVRTTSLTLLLGWPLAPSLLRMLSRLAPTKSGFVRHTTMAPPRPDARRPLHCAGRL